MAADSKLRLIDCADPASVRAELVRVNLRREAEARRIMTADMRLDPMVTAGDCGHDACVDHWLHPNTSPCLGGFTKAMKRRSLRQSRDVLTAT